MAATATFQGLIDRLTTTVQRDDLLQSYLDFANQALRFLAENHSFPEMKATGAASVAIGQTRALLPDDFKELQDGRYPIFDTPTGSQGSLVPVFARPEVEKLLPAGLVPAASFISTQDSTGGVMSYMIDLPLPATVIHNMIIYYFAYPARCDDPSSGATSPLIQKFFDMILSKACSLAFQSVNDPVYMVHEKQYLVDFQIATGTDVTRALRALQSVKG